VVKPVPDEYYERYRRVEHGQLYRELRAGSPRHLDALADTWHTVAESLRTTAEAMRVDLAEMLASWTGEGSREFQYRLGLVATFTEVLAGEAETMRAGLAAMSEDLAAAQRLADPEAPTTTEWSHERVLAATLGLVVTDEQRTESHDRLVQLVAELAVSYDLTDSRTWSTPRPPPSPDLPGRLVESDLSPIVDSVGTQLAGAVGEPRVAALPPAGLHLAAGPASPVAGAAGLPIATPRPAATLAGAGSALASSAPGAQLPAATAGSAPAATGSAGSSLPPPVMGAGHAGASTTEPSVSSGRGFAATTDTSWSSDKDRVWTDDADDPPPPILGQTRPA